MDLENERKQLIDYKKVIGTEFGELVAEAAIIELEKAMHKHASVNSIVYALSVLADTADINREAYWALANTIRDIIMTIATTTISIKDVTHANH
jgi:hypothetical protein